MWVLAIDTAGLQLAVALCHADGRLVLNQSPERRMQGELVEKFIAAALTEAGLQLKDIAGLAVVNGPGSFTGLRLGLALGQGFARGLDVPLGGYDRMSLLRRTVGVDPVIVLDSLRAELFADFGTGIEMLAPADISARLNGRPVVGDGAPQLDLIPVEVLPEAVLAARQLLADLAARQAIPAATPFYVRPPDVTVAKA